MTPERVAELIRGGLPGATVSVESDDNTHFATRVISRVRETFKIQMSLKVLFESPTIEDLARCIDKEMAEEQGADLPPIEKVERNGGLPLSYSQQRLWFIEQMEGGKGLYNVPCAVRLKGELNEAAMKRAMSEIVRRHEVLRTVFREERGEAVQVVEEPGRIELPLVDLSELATDEREAEVSKLTKAEAEQPFELR